MQALTKKVPSRDGCPPRLETEIRRPSARIRDRPSLERGVGYRLVASVGLETAEDRETDVLTDHPRRAVAHGAAHRARMEAVQTVRPEIDAVDEAHRRAWRVDKGVALGVGPLETHIRVLRAGPAPAEVRDG